MNKAQALELIELLSALESWALTGPVQQQIPPYLHENLCNSLAALRKIVLGDEK
jgi:hypothetical protein